MFDFSLSEPDRYDAITTEKLVWKAVARAFDPDSEDSDLTWYATFSEDQTAHLYSYNDNRLKEIGAHIFPVAGCIRPKQRASEHCLCKEFVALVKEVPIVFDTDALAIWDASRKLMVGYGPEENTGAILRSMGDHHVVDSGCSRTV